MNIIEFIEDPQLLNDQSLSLPQKVSLKSVYGLELDKAEKAIFRKITGLKQYGPGKERSEASFILGRRSGKSDKIASNIALYEACSRKHKLSIGQTGVVMVCASEKRRQARIVYDYCLGKLKHSKILRKMIKNVTAEEILLTNNIAIQIFPADIGKIRGAALVAFIGDETAFWKNQGVNIDVDVLDAARPGLDFEYSKMIKISTPYMMKGEIYQDFKQFYGVPNDDCLVFQGDTKLFNPSYSERKLKRMKKRKPLLYKQEYLALFRADLSSMFDPAVIDNAVDFNRPLELPPMDGKTYRCFVDVAGGGGRDSYSIAIGHLENEKAIIDVVRSRRPKFNPSEVTAQYSSLVKGYGISEVIGDKFSGDWASNSWAEHDIEYKRSEKTKSELYLEAESPFNTERVELPNKDLAITQLKNLVRKTRSGGKDSVDTDGGVPEDEANVIAGCIWLLMQGESDSGFAEMVGPPVYGDDDEGDGEFKSFDDWMDRSKWEPK